MESNVFLGKATSGKVNGLQDHEAGVKIQYLATKRTKGPKKFKRDAMAF
jgi:hypothetical protein